MPTTNEIDPQIIADALAVVHDEKTFLNGLLAETLNWPVETGVASVGDITYEWSKDDLRARDLDQKLVDGRILQLQLSDKQPWGIFILEFKRPDVFTADRGMTGILRQVLRGLVPSRRQDSTQKSWQQDHLLFICTHNYQHFRIAYFKAPKDDGRTALLAAFGWGPDIPARTACEFNLNHLGWPDDPANAVDWVEQWSSAFDVEKVTKRFYTEYRDEFESLRKKVKGLGTDTEEQKMFTQTLLNRLMFLRFIERKGWLHAPGDSKSNDYLRLLFEAGTYRGKSFYCGRLRKLFFEGLAVEGKQESEAIGKVPFLNGGLFEEAPLDEKVDDIPDKAFEPLLGENGLFYRYNFTVQESTPLNVEVAVDPEMLGKVFEELVTGRHESGSYYTPRPIVSFMCREAIKGYLVDRARLSESTVASFVDKHETGQIDITAARSLAAALDDLKAVDPACGSGAYLLGLLHEMVDLYKLLYSDKLKIDDRSLHDLKLRIISNSIYGVDIDKFATNIAMLRLWLSLSVDSANPLPLPNLDFKIATGDSLAGPDPGDMPDLFRHKLQREADELVKKKDDFLNCHDRSKHGKLAEIQLKQELIGKALQSAIGPDVIDWRIQFAEVFAGKPARATVDGRFAFVNEIKSEQRMFTVGEERGGFDIVLANPPYVRHERITGLKPQLKKEFSAVYTGTADLYVYFYARGVQLLRERGELAFISANKWFRADYGAKLRRHVLTTCHIKSITDFRDLPVFEHASAYPMIFVAKKTEGVGETLVTYPDSLAPPYPDVLALISKQGRRVPRASFRPESWDLGGPAAGVHGARTVPLREYIGEQLFNGVKTGLNSAFVIDTNVRDKLIEEIGGTSPHILPFIEGEDIKRYSIQDRRQFLLYVQWTDRLGQRHPIIKHLAQFRSRLEKRDGVKNGGSCPWFALSRPRPEAASVFSSTKIVYPQIMIRPQFTLDQVGYCLNQKCFIIPKRDLYLLALLNSTTLWRIIDAQSPKLRGGYVEPRREMIMSLPIVDASPTERAPLESLVHQCLDAKGIGCELWEKEIDERVSALYKY